MKAGIYILGLGLFGLSTVHRCLLTPSRASGDSESTMQFTAVSLNRVCPTRSFAGDRLYFTVILSMVRSYLI